MVDKKSFTYLLPLKRCIHEHCLRFIGTTLLFIFKVYILGNFQVHLGKLGKDWLNYFWSGERIPHKEKLKTLKTCTNVMQIYRLLFIIRNMFRVRSHNHNFYEQSWKLYPMIFFTFFTFLWSSHCPVLLWNFSALMFKIVKNLQWI